MNPMTTTVNQKNPLGLDGIDFIEIATPDAAHVTRLLRDFGFSRLMRHERQAIDYWRQHDIHILVNHEPGTHAAAFMAEHGPCIPSLGWRVGTSHQAFADAIFRGAKAAARVDYRRHGEAVPALTGVGDSVIYLIDDRGPEGDDTRWRRLGFVPLAEPELNPERGFLVVDHLTNNVVKGTMKPLADFYKQVFGFTEVRTFDIRGKKTGLTSYALRSPCGRFCIPINEGSEDKSQIEEYLRDYRGPGVQHIAFLTHDLLASLQAMRGSSIATLDIDPDYYATVFERVPNVSEDRALIEDLKVLVDGDDEGYLLQIFTKNLLGPIFVEMIQRKNHQSFGEGNFGALFRSIERDQEERGTL